MSKQCQQDEVYAAESGVPKGERFDSVTDIEEWTNNLRETWWWRTHYSNVRYVEVYQARKNGDGSCGSWHPERGCGQMDMHPVHFNQREVLHELAHVLTSARYGPNGHGPFFTRVYLELVSLVLGPSIYVPLWQSFQNSQIVIDTEPENPVWVRVAGPIDNPVEV